MDGRASAGRPLADVARTDPGYLQWVLTRPFLPDAHDLVRAALAAAADSK